MKFEPTRDNIAVVLDEHPKKVGLIELSHGAVTAEHITGVVIAVGPGIEEFLLNGEVRVAKAPCEVGDRVLITNGYHCDKPIIVEDGKRMIVVISACILAVIKE